MRRTSVVVTIVVGTLFPAAIAAAHSELTASEPKGGASLRGAPSSLRLEFSEPPISADNLVVEDGCGVDVVASADVTDGDIVAELSEGQPGRWNVSSRVISVVDGHETTDSLSFTVRGQADCAAAPSDPRPREQEDSGSFLPILIALAGATAVFVALALVLRRRS